MRCTCKGGPVNQWTTPLEEPMTPEPERVVYPNEEGQTTVETGDALRERYKWTKVVAPRPWKPTHNNEELLGYYGGRTLRDGPHGQYSVVIIHVPGTAAAYTVSGTRIVQLFDAALIGIGHAVRIQYLGMKDIGNDYKMKDFNVYVAEGTPIPEQDLPRVKQ